MENDTHQNAAAVANATEITAPQITPERRAAALERERKDSERAREFYLKRARSVEEYEADRKAADAKYFETSQLNVREDRGNILCVDCEGTFESKVVWIGTTKVAPAVCPACVSKRNQDALTRKIADDHALRLETWPERIPEDYLDTDVDQIRDELIAAGVKIEMFATPDLYELTPAELIRNVLDWPIDSQRGIALVGKTGRGKTRLMLKLYERYHMAGAKVEYVNAAIFGDTVGDYFSTSAAAGNAYLRRLETVPFLFLDDLGKAKLTERGEEALYRLVEVRKSKRRRTDFSANCKGSELEAKMTPDRGAPIIRRLRAMTIGISISEPQTKKAK